MFGITSSGCFLTGIVVGFILALFLGVACVFYFNPTIKEKSLSKVEEVWGNVKNKVDISLDAAKNAPTAEPQIPTGKGALQPKVEIKLGF